MLRIIISGCNGYMGQVVSAIAADDPEVVVVTGFDIDTRKSDAYPVYPNPMEYSGDADAVIDFSNPAALDNLLAYGMSKKIPLVLCTTGYTSEQITLIENTAEKIPLFRSGNMSLGINLLVDLVKRASAVLGETFDVEIVERHHRRKIDAPSGTAMMLAEAAASVLPFDSEYVYERQSRRQPRSINEIGVSAVRGGTIVGEHEVIFAGLDEVIQLRHSAASRDVFAAGALKAARYIAGVSKPGLYDMHDILLKM